MSCRQVRRALLREQELDSESRSHLRACGACRELASLCGALARAGLERRSEDLSEAVEAATRRRAHRMLTEAGSETGRASARTHRRANGVQDISDLILGWRPAAALAVPVVLLLIGVVAIVRYGEIVPVKEPLRLGQSARVVELSSRTMQWDFATRRAAIQARIRRLRQTMPGSSLGSARGGQAARLRARIAVCASEMTRELEGIPDAPNGASDADEGGGEVHSPPSLEGRYHENRDFRIRRGSEMALAAFIRTLSICTLGPAGLRMPSARAPDRGAE
jgi:hypothetical protein